MALTIDTYTYEQAQQILEIKDTALRDRIKMLGIVPERNGKTPLLNQQQIEQLIALNDHLRAGGSAATFREIMPSVLLSQLPRNSQLNKIELPQATEDKYDTDFPAILDMEVFRRNALDAIATNERLQAYAQFEIYCRSKQTMSDKDIEELIGFKPPRTGFKYDCYKFIRYSKIYTPDTQGKLQKSSTWLVEKFNPLEKKKTELLESQDLGNENYKNMKQAIAEG